LHTWGSGRFSGVARDALFLAEQIDAALNGQVDGIKVPAAIGAGHATA
jgi:putative flavoprotein involved in K+ transport